MNVCQISGLPAAGSTSVGQKRIALGYDTINTDDAWGYYGNIATEEPVEYPAEPTAEWFKDHCYIWNSTKAREVITQHGDKPLFICGGSRNEAKRYDLFSMIFILHITDEMREERMQIRNEPKHNTPLFFERMRTYNAEAYQRATAVGGFVIESDHGADAVTTEILGYIHDHQKLAK